MAFDQQKVVWILPNGEFKEIGERHIDWLYENPYEFFDNKKLAEKITKLFDKHDPAIASGKVKRIAYQNGAVRFLYDKRTNEANLTGPRETIRKHLDELIVDDKNVTYQVSLTDENGERKRNVKRKYSLNEFINEFSGRRSQKSSKSKVAKFREIVREQVKKILIEEKSNLRSALQSARGNFKYTSPGGAYVSGKFGSERDYGKVVSLNQLQAKKSSMLKGQGEGRGTKMLAEVLLEAKRRGINFYTFNAPSDAAQALHNRFEREGILKPYLTYKNIGGVTEETAVYKIAEKNPVKVMKNKYELPEL